MSTIQPVRAAHSRLAATRRWRGPDDPATGEAERDLRVARAAEYIEELVAGAPPLTPSQRRDLAGLLRPRRTTGGGE
jgi:hypothetical protein